MKTYLVKVEFEREVEAKSPREAEEIFWEELYENIAMENVSLDEKLNDSIEVILLDKNNE